ncbi:anti-sigma-factor antagonist [Isosphaera pallida ATCC 43644]|uniref:Anti-sigma factor antagonist n=1 Tax=Isosphaera pallida (strain ATCC 43644 / DSM 9630 / IS1B) TaxID=575540 RepID=E8QZ65_ISOPI|nr:STAS domain-containing protein [Isosphaera pallida]ADV63207.1 anti-sigma-factor antagonist [Isosphaera pallida ATCC 43644]
MNHDIRQVADVTIVLLDTEHLDASNSKEFRASVNPILESHSHVVFDMSKIAFVDSSGCGVLLSCLRELNSRGGDLRLCGLSPQVRSLFELVRMHKIFNMYESADEAISSFG